MGADEKDEAPRIVEELGSSHVMIMRNHGLLTTGRSVPEAFLQLYRLERACQTQIDAGAAGTIAGCMSDKYISVVRRATSLAL